MIIPFFSNLLFPGDQVKTKVFESLNVPNAVQAVNNGKEIPRIGCS